jgi:signal transduction histidine kinase
MLMHRFIANNRETLIERCAQTVARRPLRAATSEQLKNGVPMFLTQLERTLVAEEEGAMQQSRAISGEAGGADAEAVFEIGISAAAHGAELLRLGYTVDQVVHDYGDLCQAITELALERDAPMGVDEFRTLNRCLDNAIAKAVAEFSKQRDLLLSGRQQGRFEESLGFLVHELRNALSTAMLAVNAMEAGGLPVSGATGAVLKRSHQALKTLVDRALADVRANKARATDAQVFDVSALVIDAQNAAMLHATASGRRLNVEPVDPSLLVLANRERVLGALANLLQNAIKFTQPGTAVTLHAHAVGENVCIQVSDHCGGLPPGSAQTMFSPFSQRSTDKSGLGIGLSIARHNIETDMGTLTVTDIPGTGCIFSICLPRHTMTNA